MHEAGKVLAGAVFLGLVSLSILSLSVVSREECRDGFRGCGDVHFGTY